MANQIFLAGVIFYIPMTIDDNSLPVCDSQPDQPSVFLSPDLVVK